MIAVDTNILVYAHRGDSPHHEAAATAVRSLADGTSTWGIAWSCVHEFPAIATHPKIYDPPTPVDVALEQIDVWLGSPSLVMLGEGRDHWETLRGIALVTGTRGPKFHDARIAAVCTTNGVRELWSADRDFRDLPIEVVNPLEG